MVRILAATDFSEEGKPVLDFTADLVKKCGGKMYLLHAVEPCMMDAAGCMAADDMLGGFAAIPPMECADQTSTVLTIAEILLLTYTTATLPSFMILVTIAIAIPTLYPLLGFSAIELFSAPGFLVIFLLASAAWCVICAANLSRKTAKTPPDTAPPSPDSSEQ